MTGKILWTDRKPTPEELAEQAQAEYLAAVEARDAALRQALAEEADPLFFKWHAGEATEEEWRAARRSVFARHPKPEKE